MTSHTLTGRSKIWVKSIGMLSLTCLLLTCREKDVTLEPQLNVSFQAQAVPTEDYPTKVTFTNTSANADEYNWEFGTGKVSSEVSPLIEYFSSGLFPVTLTVRKGTITKSVTQPVSVPFRRLSVALIYFIPKNGTFDKELFKAIQAVNPLIQNWYEQQLGGKTYRVNRPVVDTIRGKLNSYDYRDNSIEILNSIGAEVYEKLGARIVKNEQVVLAFFPVTTISFLGVGGSIRSGGEMKRIGIVSGTACKTLTTSSASDRSLGLWTVAHELGHALGLSHNMEANSLMFGPVDNSGYTPPGIVRLSFPACQLTENDKIALNKSPFIH